MRTRDELLREWDEIRRKIAEGCDHDGPRLWFEGVIDELSEQ